MSIAVLEIKRAFRYNGILLPDVPGLEPREVRDLYSAQYPELVSAEVEPGEVRDGVQEFTFRKAVGTKGAGRKSTAMTARGGEAGPRLAALLARIQTDAAGTAGAQSKLSNALSRRSVLDRSAALSRFADATLELPRNAPRPDRSAATSDMLAPVA
ncbi:PRTRC system protein C [Ottowia sp.]|uniref:PRTRC system protein C n=1 Tax=Ottowia sp. TaxID=1898956 RepID=UPI002633B01C|nr:PRTRC system protein C [Ottowia sp.]